MGIVSGGGIGFVAAMCFPKHLVLSLLAGAVCAGCVTADPEAEEIAAARAYYTAPTSAYRCQALEEARSDATLLQRLAAEQSRFNTEGISCERTLQMLEEVFSHNQSVEGLPPIRARFADAAAREKLGEKPVELFRRQASLLEAFDLTARQAGARWWAKDGEVVLALPGAAE